MKTLPNKVTSRNINRQDKYRSFKKNSEFSGNSFFPYCTNAWNTLDTKIKEIKDIQIFKKSLLNKIRPLPAPTFNVTDHTGLKLLTRLRLGLSHLNEHKFRNNFRDCLNPLCTCSIESETTNHFLLHCHHYTQSRGEGGEGGLFDNIKNR